MTTTDLDYPTTPSPEAIALAEQLVDALEAVRRLHDADAAHTAAQSGDVGPMRQILADSSLIGDRVTTWALEHDLDHDGLYLSVQYAMSALDLDALAEETDPERIRHTLDSCAEYLASIDAFAESCAWTREQTEERRAAALADVLELRAKLADAEARIAGAS